LQAEEDSLTGSRDEKQIVDVKIGNEGEGELREGCEGLGEGMELRTKQMGAS
jgi:hypothetical protein